MATKAAVPLLLLLAALALPPALALAAASYQQQQQQLDRVQCPNLGKANCTDNDGLAFFDGCKAIACIGWRSASTNPRPCRPAAGQADQERCRGLDRRLADIRAGRAQERLVSCPQFASVDLCASADPFFVYNDGCNHHLCDGNGGRIEQTRKSCPTAVSTTDLFYCASSFNAAVRLHNTQHACSVQVNNADRICEVMWPGYRFGDACFGGADYVCGPSGRVMLRPPARLCPLVGAADSVKCREVAAQVDSLLSETSGFTCPELVYQAFCTPELRGFVYNDGCNAVMCDGGRGSGMTEGHICKMAVAGFSGQSAGRAFCERQVASVRSQLARSRRHTAPCVTAEQVCVGPDPEGLGYYDGCNHCTCLGRGWAQCTQRECPGFYGTEAEFDDHCRIAAYLLGDDDK